MRRKRCSGGTFARRAQQGSCQESGDCNEAAYSGKRSGVAGENRIKFDQNMIETVFEPGEIVRFFNHVVHRVGETAEIASKFKLKKPKV